MSANAILLASKVGVSAFEALVVSKFVHGKLLQVAIEVFLRILKIWVFVQVFELCSFESLLLDLNLELVDLSCF